MVTCGLQGRAALETLAPFTAVTRWRPVTWFRAVAGRHAVPGLDAVARLAAVARWPAITGLSVITWLAAITRWPYVTRWPSVTWLPAVAGRHAVGWTKGTIGQLTAVPGVVDAVAGRAGEAGTIVPRNHRGKPHRDLGFDSHRGTRSRPTGRK